MEIVANDNDVPWPYGIKQSGEYLNGCRIGDAPRWYVTRLGKRVSVFFPSREGAERCLQVLIDDDKARREAA